MRLLSVSRGGGRGSFENVIDQQGNDMETSAESIVFYKAKDRLLDC